MYASYTMNNSSLFQDAYRTYVNSKRQPANDLRKRNKSNERPGEPSFRFPTEVLNIEARHKKFDRNRGPWREVLHYVREKMPQTSDSSRIAKHGEKRSGASSSPQPSSSAMGTPQLSTSEEGATSKRDDSVQPGDDELYVRPKKRRVQRFTPLHSQGRQMTIRQHDQQVAMFDKGELTAQQRAALCNWIPGTT